MHTGTTAWLILAEKGINIDYVYGSIGKSADRALVVLGVSDVEAASRLLK